MIEDVIGGGIKLEKRLYWTLRTNATEWLYLLQKIIKTVEFPDEYDYVVMIDGADPSKWLYMLKRSVYGRDLVQKTLGLRDGHLQAGAVLNLDPLPRDPDVPEPTVSYYGEA